MGRMEKKIETIGLYRGYIGIMKKKMETNIYHNRVIYCIWDTATLNLKVPKVGGC